MLAEVDGALPLGLEQMVEERDVHRSGRRAVNSPLDLRTKVEHSCVAPLQELPRLVRVERSPGHATPSKWTARDRLMTDDLNDPAPVALAVELEEEHALPGAE